MLYIDTREDQSAIWEVLANLDVDLPKFEFRKLDLGDYLLENNNEKLLIERKSVSDMCSTYVELKERMNKMRTSFDLTGLLLEGNYTVQNGMIMLWRGNQLVPSMNYQGFVNFIASQQSRGSFFYRTLDLTDTLRQIICLHDYLPTMGINPVRKTKAGMNLLLQIPGVGPLGGQVIKEKYRNIGEALDNRKDWMNSKAVQIFERW
jgi:hypothetical protein